MEKVDKFLELFNPYPGNTFLEVSRGNSEITSALYTFLNKKDSSLNLAIYNNNNTLDDIYPHSKIQYIDDMKKPFRASPRSIDILILNNIFNQHSNNNILLKIGYTALANAGDIVILEEKGTVDKSFIYELLEKYEFRAANFIDIFPQYDLVIAKKMHMWGNGL